jgi:catechol 2,3-dioxygenase-like lactoylglutathione lyase family enzyme
MIKFAYTILYVKNVTKSLTFYEKAFGLTKKFVTPDNSYGEVETGETTLSFAVTTLAKSNLKEEFEVSKPRNKPFGIEVAFTTDNVQATVQSSIKAGAILVTEPTAKPWGQIVAYVRDPDGFLIEICTPVH